MRPYQILALFTFILCKLSGLATIIGLVATILNPELRSLVLISLVATILLLLMCIAFCIVDFVKNKKESK